MADLALEHFDYGDGTHEVPKEIQNMCYGQSIVRIDEPDGRELILTLSNGVKLIAEGNEGCGGCANGWFYYDKVITLGTDGNVITKVDVDCDCDGEHGEYTLNIYSLDNRILTTTFTGDDNGYYGVGIYIRVRIPDTK